MSSPTLRAALLAAAGPSYSIKNATMALIQASRASRKDPGTSIRPYGARAAVERALDLPSIGATELVAGLAQDLRRLHRATDGPTRDALLDSIENALLKAIPTTVGRPVGVRVTGWPPQLPVKLQRRLLGWPADVSMVDPVPLDPAEAAALRHRLHDQDIGGCVLEVDVDLGAHEVLPALPRTRRQDRGRHGRPPPWLAHLDDQGRRSLTPLSIARSHAQRVGPVTVFDACCGCGGSAIAFAMQGAQVEAWELNPERTALARRNVQDKGLQHRVRVHSGDGLIAALKTTADVLFLDPPWEVGDTVVDRWSRLCAALPGLDAAVNRHAHVMLKLPRRFVVASLPGGTDAWSLRYELGRPETGDAQVVRMITATRTPAPATKDAVP